MPVSVVVAYLPLIFWNFSILKPSSSPHVTPPGSLTSWPPLTPLVFHFVWPSRLLCPGGKTMWTVLEPSGPLNVNLVDLLVPLLCTTSVTVLSGAFGKS